MAYSTTLKQSIVAKMLPPGHQSISQIQQEIGVTDQKEVAGIDAGGIQEEMDRISNIVHDCIRPILAPDLYVQAMAYRGKHTSGRPSRPIMPYIMECAHYCMQLGYVKKAM